MEIQEKLDQIGSAFDAFKKANDKEIAEIKAKGDASALTKEAVEKANADISKLQTELKNVEAALNRSQKGGESKTEAQLSREQKEARSEIMQGFLRRKNFEPSETMIKAAYGEKAMQTLVDEDGGFLVSPELASEVVTKVYDTSPMRQLADVQTISTDSLEFIEDLDEAGAGWVGETEARTETGTPQIQKISIPVHEIYASPKATQKQLDDAAWNVEQWLTGKVADKFSRMENTSFVSGDGVKRPKGFLSYTAGTTFGTVEQMNSGSATVITGDNLIDLQALLKDHFGPNAKWVMNKQIEKAIRKLKNAVSGDYIWQPGLQAGTPNQILGKEVVHADDMASSIADGNLIVSYGDFKKGYQIVDRIGIRVIRDIYTAKPYVLFYTTKRVGGGVKDFEAIKIMKSAT